MGKGLSRGKDLVHESIVSSALRRFVNQKRGWQSETGEENDHAESIVQIPWEMG